MSDFNSSQPIRTEANGDVVAFLADGTTPSQLLAIDSSGRLITKLDDGNGNIITSQANGSARALDVGINVAGVQIDPRIIRALTAADVVTTNQGIPNTIGNAWPVKLTDGTNTASLTALGEVKVSVTEPLPAGTNLIGKFELTDGTSVVGVAAASTAAATTQPAAIVALSPNTALPAGTNALGSVLSNLQVASAPVTVANPVPVTVVSSVPGTNVQDYHTSVALAAGSSVTFTYTVAASHTFNLERIWTSASGKIKAVIQNGTTTIMTGFNSTANPNIDMTIVAPPTITAAGTVNVIITNDDKQPFDVYCTIEGNQN